MTGSDSKPPHKRRARYRGSHPRRFEQKYKELDPSRDPETIAKVIASGKTPAGHHRPVLVAEVLEHLSPKPGERGADVTLGYGGHAEALLQRLDPAAGGRLLGLDLDADQLPRTEERLRGLGFDDAALILQHSNYADTAETLAEIGWDDGVDFLLADLGVSSMQIDNPARGFSYKHDGPLDMRMNSEAPLSAQDWLLGHRGQTLARALVEGGDEPRAELLAKAIDAATAKAPLETTLQLRRVIENALPRHLGDDVRNATLARVFQAIRIAVNQEFDGLDRFLDRLPDCLRPGGRVAILSFHSGEDRRVKLHFRDGLRGGIYTAVAPEILRPTVAEVAGNARASAAKMRWAIKA